MPVDYDQIPTVTFTHPTAGMVGLTEPQAVEKHGDTVRIYETQFGGLNRAFAEGEVPPVAMKLVCVGDDEKVVGIHMIGANVDEMLQGFAVAVRMGATKRDLDLTIPLHPTSAEELVTLKEGRQGYDIVAPVPSCVLMFKQELPLMFPDDADVIAVRDRIFDPFEYLMERHKDGKLNTDFPEKLGKIAYHAACHLRVQNMGLKTRDLLKLVPETEIDVIERCSGHDGTYGVKSEFYETASKICRPVVSRVQKAESDHYSSDCPMAGHMIENGLQGKGEDKAPEHPLTLLRQAYGL